MGEPSEGVNVPEDWIGRSVLVLSHKTGETLLPGSGYPLVADIYSGELRAVNGLGISLSLLNKQEEAEGDFYPGGDTFFPWNAVLRLSLAVP